MYESRTVGDETKPLGVLFVHGIGDQPRGETLTAFGDALYRWYRRWFGHERDGDAGVELMGTRLEPDPEDPVAPAHCWLRFTPSDDSQDRTPVTYLLAESNWAQTFTIPKFSDVARWGLLVLPWTIVVQFAANLREMAGEYGGTLRNYPLMVAGVVFYVLALFLGALTQILVLLVLVLAAIPIPMLRRFFIAVELKLAATIGDCYVLLESPIRSSAITSRVRCDLDWLSRRCGDIAIVAHSQGAAVTHRVLANPVRSGDPILSRVRLFLSVGSGIGKLHDVEEALKPGTHIKWLGPFVMTSLILAVFTLPPAVLDLARETSRREAPPLLSLIGILTAWGGLFTLAVLSDWSGKHRRKLVLAGLPKRMRWVDRYATGDPVPSGPLLKKELDEGVEDAVNEQPMPDSAPVHNQHSLLSDHTIYLRNEDEFVTELAVELASCMPPPREMPSRQTVALASQRRRWRVLWLSAIRIVIATAFLGTVWVLRADLGAIGMLVIRGLLAASSIVDSIESSWMSSLVAFIGREASPVPLAIVALGLSFLCWHGVVFQIWLWWNRWDTARLFARRNPDAGGAPFVFLVAVALVAPLGAFVAWFAGISWEVVRSAAGTVWGARTSVGDALVGWLMFCPMMGLFLAMFRSVASSNKDRGKKDLDMWEFAVLSAATAALALPAMVWLSIVYPEPFRGPRSGAGGLEQLAAIAVIVGPPMVAGLFVGLFVTLVGDRLGTFLKDQSVSSKRALVPRPAYQIGILSCAAGGASVLVSLFLDPQNLTVSGVVVMGCLWLVSGLASVNAMARGREKSLADRLAYGGVMLIVMSLVVHAR
jgi:hypothetical protein